MLGEQQSTSISNTKSEYWKDKHWNDTNGLLWFVQVGISIQFNEIVNPYLMLIFHEEDFQKYEF